jgi:hypothetical protein
LQVLHCANAAHAVSNNKTRNFWWQVARAPNIKNDIGRQLSNRRHSGGLFYLTPANFIYYPENKLRFHQTKIAGCRMTDDVVLQVVIGKGEEPLRRNELTVILKHTGCPGEEIQVRLIDGSSPDLSIGDPQRILLIASNSKLDNVLTSDDQPVPPVHFRAT